ncbi:hypothetical protein EPA93_15465 [Ktedonosporobacter rubrisoli]|uniref:Lantibiotic dehydratase n=1 Tax=Ktedonosporobacter rubrisoli TaxID=2509675 RepID=A0A4P6JPZ9_KTERU|nr:lantibiotic dehydratase [Ktedonosporobacter rubrisoli]QBD77313.1 hypothetical protein EPA93_15465 [Ktedonosporobacter rubrisoli]
MHSSTRTFSPTELLTSHAVRYTPLDFIQVRAPLFPIEAYLSLQQPSAVAASGLHPQNPLVRRALAIGSIDFLEELDRQASSPRDRDRWERKLLRYLIRMATRPTPYGLFAGVSLARWGEQTNVQIANRPRILFSRPDLNWLLPLLWELETLPEIRRHLHYLANRAAFVRNGRIFLQEQLALGQPNQNETVSLRATPVALLTLKLARQPISHSDLVQELLAAVPRATLSQVEELITSLWQYTLLFTDLHPPFTGQTLPAQYVVQRLENIPFAAPVATLLQNFLRALRVWDQTNDEESIERYHDLQYCAQEINTKVETLRCASQPTYLRQVKQNWAHFPSSTFVQTDSSFSLVGQQLARKIGQEIENVAPRLLRPQRPHYLQAYRMAFLERYGTDREVPLLEVMDSQIGLGVPAFALKSVSDEMGKQSERDQELSRLALMALHERQGVIALDEESLQRLALVPPSDKVRLPLSFDLFVWLAATSRQALAEEKYQIVIGPHGTYQAGQSLGRFASYLGTEAVQVLEHSAQQEAEREPHVLQAELVYTSSTPRSMNVALRPAIRRYEVIYGVVPGVSMADTIPLDELVLGVQGERFYLYWPRQQMEVRPCSSHLLQSRTAPSIMRFLSDLSLDGTYNLSPFHWGRCVHFPFLPRLQIGRVVLSLAQWSLSASFHENELCLASPEQFQETLSCWRERWRVPRYVYLAEGDNRLLLDLEQVAQAEELRSTLRARKKTQTVMLQEALPGPEHAWLEGPDGHYLSEFVVPLIRCSSTPSRERLVAHSPLPSKQIAIVNAERLKAPGSDWLFLKLYSAPTLHEELIADPLRTLVQKVFTQKLAESWFFIRYTDPDPHLRLRFRGNPSLLTSQLFQTLCSWASQLVSDGRCLKFAFDSYEREIERYGGLEGMALAEKLFDADSSAVIELLHLKRARRLTLAPQMLAVLTTDDLLASLELSPQERLHWYRQSLFNTKEVGMTYRLKSAELRALLKDTHYIQKLEGGMQLLKILNTRRICISQIAQQLSDLETQQGLMQPLSRMYASFTHMHYNRLQGINRQRERDISELALRTWMGLLGDPRTT